MMADTRNLFITVERNDKKNMFYCVSSILLDPQLWLEGSYELGLSLPSFCLSF